MVVEGKFPRIWDTMRVIQPTCRDIHHHIVHVHPHLQYTCLMQIMLNLTTEREILRTERILKVIVDLGDHLLVVPRVTTLDTRKIMAF